MIPQTFNQWQECIVNDCKIPLTPDFAKQRLAVYLDDRSPERKKFIELYGERHLKNVIDWFSRVLSIN